MTKALYSQGEPDATAVSSANATEYWFFPAAGSNCSMVSTTEADNQVLHKNAGIFSDLSIKIGTNGISGGTTTFRFRINAANGNMSIPIPASSTGLFQLADASVTDTIAAGDKTSLQSTPGGTTGTMVQRARACCFTNTSSSETISRLGCGNYPSGANLNTASSTSYEGIVGEAPLSYPAATEANAKCRIRKAGTVKNLAIYVLTNARTTNTTLKLRKNGVDTTQVITVATGQTGYREQDTPANTTSVAVGDDLNWSIVTGTGTGAFRILIYLMDYVTTDGWFPCGNSTTDAANQASALTRFQPLGGFKDTNNTETNVSIYAGGNFRFTELATLVITNGIAATSSVSLVKNGTASALSASITSSTTGVFVDSANIVTVATNDTLSFQMVTGGAAGNLNIKNIIMWGQEIVLPQTVYVEWEEA